MKTSPVLWSITSEPITGWRWVDADRLVRPHEHAIAGGAYSLPPGNAVHDLRRLGYAGHLRALPALDDFLTAHLAPAGEMLYVCKVALSGVTLHDGETIYASQLRIEAMSNATTLLHTLACDTADHALESERTAGRPPDERFTHAIMLKRRWLRGEASADTLSIASSNVEIIADTLASEANCRVDAGSSKDSRQELTQALTTAWIVAQAVSPKVSVATDVLRTFPTDAVDFWFKGDVNSSEEQTTAWRTYRTHMNEKLEGQLRDLLSNRPATPDDVDNGQ